MNDKGSPENLIAAHPGNRNALKSGMYSPRVQEERAREVRSWLQQASLSQLLDELVLSECEKLLSLRNLLEAAIDAHGVTDRRGEMRDIVKARLSISRRIDNLVERIASVVPQEDDGEAAIKPQPGSDKYRDRYEARKGLAFDPKVPCNVRIDAIQDLWATRPPARPSPAENVPREEGGLAVENPWVGMLLALGEGHTPSDFESSSSCDSQEDSPRTELDTVRARCIEVLHTIGTAREPDVHPAHRRRALKLVQSLDPAPRPSLQDRELEEFLSLDTKGQYRKIFEVMRPLDVGEVLDEMEAKGLGDRFEIIERGSEGELVLKSASGDVRARLPMERWPRMWSSGGQEEPAWNLRRSEVVNRILGDDLAA